MVVRRQCAADAARPPDWGLGWTVGQNIRIDYRWGAGNADLMRKHAADLVASSPEVILAHSSAAVAPLLQESRTIPIPGLMLNRLNPMKDIDLLSRAELVERYNEMRPAFGSGCPPPVS